MNIRFEKASFKYEKAIFEWLEEPHVKEFWDNSQGHKDDILNFMGGRKEPSSYEDGRYVYWVGLIDEEPYSLIMTIKEFPGEERPQLKEQHLSKTGSTYGIDYMIGNKEYLGKGFGAKTLKLFVKFFHKNIDTSADTFFIDPDLNNRRARHVYEKAGFQYVGDFIMEGEGVFAGRTTHFLVKKIKSELDLIPATLNDYPVIQNMTQFYIYETSRVCGFSISGNGLYEPKNYKSYLENPDRKAFLLKVEKEIAGFLLLNTVATSPDTDWNVGEFFVLAKFHGTGIAHQAVHKIWKQFPGIWEISVPPENKRAIAFWRKAIFNFIGGNYAEELKRIDFDAQHPKRHIFTFNTKSRPSDQTLSPIKQAVLTPELRKRIFEGFSNHAIKSIGIDGLEEEISFEISSHNQVIGCVVVQLFWGQLHVKYVFVEEEYRGQKIATRLMKHAFEFGKEKGCDFAFVESMNFQAPEFYQKLGFKTEFTRPGYLKNTSFHYLKKDLHI